MSKKKLFLAVAGTLGAVGAYIGIKKIVDTLSSDEILFTEDEIFSDIKSENACTSGCCSKTHDEYTENIANIEDLREMGVSDEILESINNESFEEDLIKDLKED